MNRLCCGNYLIRTHQYSWMDAVGPPFSVGGALDFLILLQNLVLVVLGLVICGLPDLWYLAGVELLFVVFCVVYLGTIPSLVCLGGGIINRTDELLVVILLGWNSRPLRPSCPLVVLLRLVQALRQASVQTKLTYVGPLHQIGLQNESALAHIVINYLWAIYRLFCEEIILEYRHLRLLYWVTHLGTFSFSLVHVVIRYPHFFEVGGHLNLFWTASEALTLRLLLQYVVQVQELRYSRLLGWHLRLVEGFDYPQVPL